MTTHYDDEAQAEQLKRWWSENWKSLAVGLGIGLSAIFGWEAWQGHREQRSQQASQMYEDLKKALAADKTAEATTLADQLAAQFAATPYASDAALRVAAEAVEAQQLDEAVKRLQWAMDHSADPGIVRLARLRLARVLWQQNKPDEALKRLEGDAGAFGAQFAELRGDIRLSQGDRKAAREAYEQAMQAQGEAAANKDNLQRKLDDLADQATAVAVQQ